MAGQDYYEVLGVSKNDDTARIKAAYRDLALKYHPDRNRTPEAQDRMMAVNEAYAVLSDPEKRRNYDGLQQQYGPSRGYTHFRQAYSDQDIFSGTDIHKVFEEMAKSFGVRNFEEISKEFYGKTNAFEFKNSRGHFKGFFFSGTMGPGTAFSKANGPGFLGRAARTLLGRITGGQLPDQDLNRRDTIRIDPELARSGGPYAYYHKWRDKKLVVNIPPGIRQGQKIRLRGMGREGRGRAGDLYLEIHTKSSLMDAIRRVLPFK